MHSGGGQRTAVALLVLLVTTRVAATFTGCDGVDFVSKQCAEDGETIAPLLTENISEHDPFPTTHQEQQKSIKSVKDDSTMHANGKELLQDIKNKVPQASNSLKEQRDASRGGKTIKQSTLTTIKSPEVQIKVGSHFKTKEGASTTLNAVSKAKPSGVVKAESNKRFQTTSGSSDKLKKQLKQEINVETSSVSSIKNSPQSFTQKLHNTVTKINRVSSLSAAPRQAPKDGGVIQNRSARSLPNADLVRTSNSLKNQPSSKDNPVGKSTHAKATEELDQGKGPAMSAHSETTDDKSKPPGREASKTKTEDRVPKKYGGKHSLKNPKSVSSYPPVIDSLQSPTEFESNKHAENVDKSQNAEKPSPEVLTISVTQLELEGSAKNNLQHRFRRSASEQKVKLEFSDNQPTEEAFSISPTSSTTANYEKINQMSVTTEVDKLSPTTTLSDNVAEDGFTKLPEKFDFLHPAAVPVDEKLAKHIKQEKPALLLAIEQKNDNIVAEDKVKNNNNQKPWNENKPLADHMQISSFEAHRMDMYENPKLEEKESSRDNSIQTKKIDAIISTSSEFTVASASSAPPIAESLLSDVRQEDYPITADVPIERSTEVETLPAPNAIRMDGIDRDPEYAVDDRLRPVQRPVAPKLDFPDVPEGESFHIQDLGLSEGLFVFSYLSSFLSWIQPYDFPVELLRDALWKRVSVVDLITQSLQVEVGFIVCLTVGVLLALGVPCILLVHACCRMFDSKSSSDSWNEQEGMQADNCAGNCRRVTLVFIMQLVLVLLVAGIVSMFVTNEQMSHAVEQTPTVVHTALNDAITFLRNSHQQLRFVITKTLDQAVDATYTDLDNIEELLGRPIQDQIAVETGVDVALDALIDVSAEARAISTKVEGLLSQAAATRDLIVDSRERLADLRLQVDLFRRQCPSRFRPLCDTVDTTGLDVVLRLESLMTEQRLTRVRDLRDGNLTLVAQQARGEFQFVPMRVEKETRDTRNAIKRQLARQKEALYDSAWSLDVVSRDLSYRVEEARNTAMQIARGIGEVEQWRWLTGLGAASSVLFLWLLLLAGITCGCCGVEGRAGSTLLASVVLMSIFSVGLWALALSALLVGGHGEVFVCRPLYDEPGYTALTRLVDRPGVLFQRSSGGFFSNLLYGNGTLDVPLRDVLEECQADGPTYRAFRLHQVFDVDSASDHRRWENLHVELRRLRVDLSDLQLLTPELQVQLQEMLMATTVNLTNFRAQISRQVMGRDLSSFADQLMSVANQITDLATLSRLETLASRTRRLLLSHIQPLEQRKEDLVYQLTALEVQMAPLQRQVNQSLSHLKTIQFFIDNQAGNIAAQKSEDYVARLISYMDQFRDHVLNTTKNFVAPCRPIWNLYHAMRVLFCRHVMDPLNGFWFATVWCLLLFLVATPPCLKLVDHYRHLKMQHQHNNSLLNPNTESPSETLMISDQGGNWSTPGSGEHDGW